MRVRHLALPASVPDGPELLAVPAFGLDDNLLIWPTDDPLTYVLAIVAINAGESTEYVEDRRVETLDGKWRSGANDGTEPRELRPRERVTWAFRPDRAAFDLRDGFMTLAVLASDKRIESGPHYLDDRLRQQIAAHNAELATDEQPSG